MSVLAMMTVKVKSEYKADFENWFKEETKHTRGFEGCNSVTIHRDQTNPNHMLFLGDWDSRQHHENYLAWRSERGDMEKLMAWFEEPAAFYFDEVQV